MECLTQNFLRRRQTFPNLCAVQPASHNFTYSADIHLHPIPPATLHTGHLTTCYITEALLRTANSPQTAHRPLPQRACITKQAFSTTTGLPTTGAYKPTWAQSLAPSSGSGRPGELTAGRQEELIEPCTSRNGLRVSGPAPAADSACRVSVI